MMKKGLYTICCLFAGLLASAQTANDEILRGNAHYAERRFGQALERYAEALRLEPGSFAARFNKATALARLGKTTEAAVAFAEAESVAPDDKSRANTHYNQGVLLAREQKWKECADACKQALRLNPADSQARDNLQLALLRLRQQSPSKKPSQKPRPQPQPPMSRDQAEQRLKMLEQKEKELQQRMRSAKNQGGGSRPKDW